MNRDNPNAYRVYDTDGVGPCLGTMGGGGREPHIIDPKYRVLEGTPRIYEDNAPALQARDYKDPLMVAEPIGNDASIEVIGKSYERENYGDNRNRILGGGGIAPSLTATQYKEPYRVGVSLSETLTLRDMG